MSVSICMSFYRIIGSASSSVDGSESTLNLQHHHRHHHHQHPRHHTAIEST